MVFSSIPITFTILFSPEIEDDNDDDITDAWHPVLLRERKKRGQNASRSIWLSLVYARHLRDL